MSAKATFWGHFSQPDDLAEQHEALMDRPFTFTRTNAHLAKAHGGMNYLDDQHDRILDSYGIATRGFRNANCDPPMTFGRVAQHKHDEELAALAVSIDQDARYTHENPLIFSPHHEQAVDTTQAHEPNDNQPGGGAPEDYADFYRVVHDVFRDHGLLYSDGGKVRFAFVPQMPQYLPEKLAPKRVQPWLVDKIMPDPALFDFIGVDIYSKPNNKRPDASELDYVHAKALELGKRFLIGEIGAHRQAEAGAQAVFIADACARIKSYGQEKGSCYMLCWTLKDFPDGTSTVVAGDPAAEEAWITGARDSHFRRGL